MESRNIEESKKMGESIDAEDLKGIEDPKDKESKNIRESTDMRESMKIEEPSNDTEDPKNMENSEKSKSMEETSNMEIIKDMDNVTVSSGIYDGALEQSGPTFYSLPDCLLATIFTKMPPKVPEKLRLTCKKFNEIYLKNEGKLQLPTYLNWRLHIFHSLPQMGFTLYLKDVSVSPRRNLVKYHHPSFQKLLKCLRLATDLYFGLFIEWPEFFDKDRCPRKFHIIQRLVEQKQYETISISSCFPDVIQKVLAIFPQTVRSKFVLSTTFETLEELTDAEIKRIHEISSSVVWSKARIEAFLKKFPHLAHLSAHIEEPLELDHFLLEWAQGRREIEHWEFTIRGVPYEPSIRNVDSEVNRSSLSVYTRNKNGETRIQIF